MSTHSALDHSWSLEPGFASQSVHAEVSELKNKLEQTETKLQQTQTELTETQTKLHQALNSNNLMRIKENKVCKDKKNKKQCQKLKANKQYS